VDSLAPHQKLVQDDELRPLDIIFQLAGDFSRLLALLREVDIGWNCPRIDLKG